MANRRQGVVKHVKEEMGYMEDDYDDEELEDQYTEGIRPLKQINGSKSSILLRL